MEVLSAAGGELGGRQVADRLPRHAYTTVVTVLDRLSNKGLVRRRLEGRTRRYAALGSGADHAAALMHEAFRSGGEPGPVLAAFLGSMTRTERTALERSLESILTARGGERA